MKSILLLLSLFSAQVCLSQAEDWYGPAKISFHGFICNRPTNDDPLGMDGVSDEVSVDFWSWSPITTNRARYAGIQKIYGENFLLPNRVKAGTATINGGIKAGDSYFREGVYGDNDLNILSNYDIVTTFCSNSTLVAIFPTIFERDEGPLHTSPFQDLYLATRRAFEDPDIQQGIQDFSQGYTYNENNPFGFVLAGRHIGLDAKFAGMFSANKNKLASRPIGLFSNWDYSSQLLVLTPKTIKTIAEKDYGYGKGILPVYFNEETMGNTFGHGNYIVLLRVRADIKDRNAGNPAPAARAVSMKVNNLNPGEEYKFRLWTVAGLDTITIRHPNTTGNFTRTLSPGQFYNVLQVAGPKTCQLINDRGSVGQINIVVTANCATSSSQYKIGIGYSSSLFPNAERYEFLLNGTQRLVLDSAHTVAYFEQKLNSGEAYAITQVSGPRTCTLLDRAGTVGNQDILLNAECGSPPLSIFKINLVGTAEGETFMFADNYGRTYRFPFSTMANLGGYPQGSYFRITQTGGPRSCKLTNNEGTVTTNGIIVQADCSKPLVLLPPPTHRYDLVSRSSDDKILNTYYESFTPVIGGRDEDEGRYVAFVAYGKGIDGSDGKRRQIFWRDRKSGVTRLVSKNAAGEQANGDNFAPAISADGQSVAFESYATNFGEADNNVNRDIYVWSARSGALTLVSRSQNGGASNGESAEPSISGDGSVIAYTSHASDIVTLQPVFSTPNVYVYSNGSNQFITKDFETGKAAGGYSPSISEDGNKVAFCAYTGRLVKNDSNNLWDIFLWESGMPGLKRLSFTSSGAERNQGTESASRVVAPSISGDGRFVAYATTASNMVPGDNNAMQDIFLCSTSGGSVQRISQLANKEGNGDSPISQGERIGISYDGSWITYNTNADNLGAIKGNIVLQNTKSGQVLPVTTITNGSTARPMISRSGSYVIAGCSEKYDKRFASSGIFVFYPHK